MSTSYFTFGQNHTHRYGETTLDCDIVVKITAEDPRARMFELFGQEWSMEYDEIPQEKLDKYYHRGIFEI